MATQIGRLTDLGIGVESTRLTAVTASTWVPWASLTYDDIIQQVTNDSAVGVINNSIDAQVDNKMAEGSLTAYVGIDTIDPFFESLLGSKTTSADTPESGVDTDTYTIAQNNEHPTLSIYGKDENETALMTGAMFSSLEFSMEQDAYMQVSGDFMADVTTASSATASYSSETNFLPKHITVEFASNHSSLDDSDFTDVRSVTLTIEQNVTHEFALGSVEPINRFNGAMNISGSMELLYRNNDFRDDMLGDTKQAMRIKAKNDDVTIGNSTNPEIQFDLHKIKFGERTRSRGLDDMVTETVNFTAHYDLGDAKEMEITRVYSP